MANSVTHHDSCDWLRPGEASRISGITRDGLARMANAGKLTSSKPGGSHRRYVRAEIEALAVPVTIKRTKITEALNK